MTRSLLFLLLAVSTAMFVTGCCNKGQMAPDETVTTAGWESAGGEPAALTALPPARGNPPPANQDAELDALRRANNNLMNKVAGLMTDVDRMEAAQAAPAAEPVELVVAPAPAPEPVVPTTVVPTTTVEGVREILEGESVDDLPVTMNPRGDVVVTLPGSLSFGSGKAQLKSSAQDRLKRVVAALSENFPDLSIRAEGHTDSDPIRKSKWASNQELSEARASAVEKYLRRLDMDVSSVGFGSTRPVASNASSAGKAQNRRVELVLVQ